MSLCVPLCLLTVMPRFTEQVEAAVEALSANNGRPLDENEFIDASRLVYDGVRDIRKAVLMIRVRRSLVKEISKHLLISSYANSRCSSLPSIQRKRLASPHAKHVFPQTAPSQMCTPGKSPMQTENNSVQMPGSQICEEWAREVYPKLKPYEWINLECLF